MRRSGIALLIALLFIITLMALAAVFMKLSREAFERIHSQQSMLANIAMLHDLKEEVVGPLVDLADRAAKESCQLAENEASCIQEVKQIIFESLYQLPLSFAHEGTRTLLTCSPTGTHLDINRLRLEQNATNPEVNTPAHFRRTHFERFLQDRYRLYATWQFLELLDFVFDTTGEINAYLQNDNRLFVSDNRYYRGAILDERHFYQLVQDYVLLSHDEGALEVPWQEFLLFGAPTDRLQLTRLSPKSCELSFWGDLRVCESEVPFETREDLMSLSNEANLTVHHFNIHTAFNPVMQCRVLWQSGRLSHTYFFDYHLDEKALRGFSIGY